MRKLSTSLIILFAGLNTTSVLADTSNTTEEDTSSRSESKKDIYDNENKHVDDPTRVVTKLGLAGDYNFESEKFGYSISGSIGLSDAQKINLRYHPDSEEWTLGGSWLFNFGIVNFNFGKSEYEDGSNFNNYSIGTFVPLSVFGIEPAGWQIFPMAGFNYTDGERPLNEGEPDFDPSNPYVLHPSDSTGGYLGYFSLKPVTEEFTVITFAGASVGSDDYFGYWLGAGMGYKFTKKDSINLLGIVTDNDYGAEQKIILAYSHTFSD
ncbi:hypothetical protein BCT61_17370 [Vibrio breoganii]|uniref:hypothetical protein n=1 Tax=Vibrio breoganii TaxID=553239 RepID=UPI000C85715E|nr:hypothetical protein [Vibrio breoganii]PMI19386.1 hypothetical protein BCU49_09885 [Vibrio breoganii]PML39470.1 hypothetical protein BCT77_11015 [Vibrio breoganii]PMM03929.1 hypothetical protein BCT61_17370 [Vibrio breoganii]PMO78732.1 hypothetical protein BCT02_00445 [Vibrio breoganii]PMO85623.1 hypothetical protein BCS99_14070 [Vibrio breoganii]